MAEFETRIVSLIKSGMSTDELLSTLGYDPKSLPAEFSALISSLMSIIATMSDKLDGLDVNYRHPEGVTACDCPEVPVANCLLPLIQAVSSQTCRWRRIAG